MSTTVATGATGGAAAFIGAAYAATARLTVTLLFRTYTDQMEGEGKSKSCIVMRYRLYVLFSAGDFDRRLFSSSIFEQRFGMGQILHKQEG